MNKLNLFVLCPHSQGNAILKQLFPPTGALIPLNSPSAPAIKAILFLVFSEIGNNAAFVALLCASPALLSAGAELVEFLSGWHTRSHSLEKLP